MKDIHVPGAMSSSKDKRKHEKCDNLDGKYEENDDLAYLLEGSSLEKLHTLGMTRLRASWL